METRKKLQSSPKTPPSDSPILPSPASASNDGDKETDSQPNSNTDTTNTEAPHRRRRKKNFAVHKRHDVTPTEDSFQKEVDKWEELYDDMQSYLTDGSLEPRSQANILRQAESYSLDHSGRLYFTKTLREGAVVLTLPVVRSYQERMQVCRSIHLSTGDECIHNRRDTMLELLGQQYYWKGQRRDVCQCIASCAMCSIGLGGKRRAKPPSQRRDIRPTHKIPRIEPSLPRPPLPPSHTDTRVSYTPTPTSSVSPDAASRTQWWNSVKERENGSNCFETTSNGIPKSLAVNDTVVSQAHTLTSTDAVAASITQQQDAVRGSAKVVVLPEMENYCVSGLKISPAKVTPVAHNSAFTPVDPLANLYTIAEACLLNNSASESSSAALIHASRSNPELSVASEVTVSDNSGLQIFTTINEPYYIEGHEASSGQVGSVDQGVVPSTVCVGGESAVVGEDEQYVVQGSSSGGTRGVSEAVREGAEPSIYQLLFQLPSKANSSLCTAVMESMHMALKNTVDPHQLALAASQSLTSVFNLPSSSSTAFVCPSRSAAYLTALSSILTHQGLTNTQLTHKTNSNNPPIVLHDAVCSAGSPQVFSPLLGACNWSLGTHARPMDRELLQATVTSNRVTAVLYRPYVYPQNTEHLSLPEIASICYPRGISIVVDCAIRAGNMLDQLTAAIKEMLTKGADLIMLPNTEQFQGPPHTCVVIGKASLLGGHWEQLSLLQSSLSLPLMCSSYDTVGSVVAFKSLQVARFKSEPANHDL